MNMKGIVTRKLTIIKNGNDKNHERRKIKLPEDCR